MVTPGDTIGRAAAGRRPPPIGDMRSLLCGSMADSTIVFLVLAGVVVPFVSNLLPVEIVASPPR
jgi:hypothetical protein